MSGPTTKYDSHQSLQFGGALPESKSFAESASAILPIPFDRTTSYVPGTRNGPRELLLASGQVELWDEELGADVHELGMFTLPEMDLTGVREVCRPHRVAQLGHQFWGAIGYDRHDAIPAERHDGQRHLVVTR